MKFKVKSIAKALSDKYGGKWKYKYPCTWECDDGNRYVNRVSTSSIEDGYGNTDASALCMYFRDNQPPEWVY